MDLTTFRRVVTTFADRPVDVDLSRGTLLAELRDEVVEARVLEREGTIWIDEGGGQEVSAFHWLINRVARLPMLADRILSYVPEEPHFVRPAGLLIDLIEASPGDVEREVADAVDGSFSVLANKLAGVSSILYLTSDAGEGKTTLINQMARYQAQRFRDKQADWLLVPISLGGRPFMRLDDVVVAELTNRLRFLMFYNAFTELVRLNVVVPALDGFEEVFVESSTGEAVSALGNLLNELKGSGRVLIAARKAYFEIRSFASQARFFDTLNQDTAVDFARLALLRWSRSQFEEYARNRGLANAREVYERVSQRLPAGHPLLTRAVLVERLVDVALDGEVGTLLERLGTDPEDYFFQFVNTIIEREATKKWIDRTGDAARPLISVAEHHELLAMVAREMWISSTDALRNDYIELIADLFGSEHEKTPTTARQIKERLHQHSLLASTGEAGRQIGFDHEDFRRFFLGQALAAELERASESSLTAFLRVAALPSQTADAAVSRITRTPDNLAAIRNRLHEIGSPASDTSYVKENAGLLLIRVVEAFHQGGHTISKLNFPVDALRGRRIESIGFENCHFQPSLLSGTTLVDVRFSGCRFERIEVGADVEIENVTIHECTVGSLHFVGSEETLFDPVSIDRRLAALGVSVIERDQVELALEHTGPDEQAALADVALRAFMRSTHLNENVFRQRLGTRANEFFDVVLPEMLTAQVIQEVPYRGGGRQRRFKLAVPMRTLEKAIRGATDLNSLLEALKEQ
jgi:hypothetical protein